MVTSRPNLSLNPKLTSRPNLSLNPKLTSRPNLSLNPKFMKTKQSQIGHVFQAKDTG